MSSPWWFLLAAIALIGGIALLTADARRRGARTRLRQEWARSAGMRFTTSDPVLTGQWSYGLFTRGGPGQAVNLVSGEHGGASVHVFDLDRRGTLGSTVVALRRPTVSATAFELTLGSSEAPGEAGTDLLGPVGPRYCFTSDLESARRAVDDRMVGLAEDAGPDVGVLWAENGWALAGLPSSSGPTRWAETIDVLARFADLLRVLPSAQPVPPKAR